MRIYSIAATLAIVSSVAYAQQEIDMDEEINNDEA